MSKKQAIDLDIYQTQCAIQCKVTLNESLLPNLEISQPLIPSYFYTLSLYSVIKLLIELINILALSTETNG